MHLPPLKIALTGTESTGKTTLTRQLASHFGVPFELEYAREYLQNIGLNYSKQDVLNIAAGQLDKIKNFKDGSKNIIFFDTELIVSKIWFKHRYGYSDPSIEKYIELQKIGLFLLCAPDIGWQPDPLREHAAESQSLFECFESELQSYHFNYKIVRGSGEERLKNAIQIIVDFLG